MSARQCEAAADGDAVACVWGGEVVWSAGQEKSRLGSSGSHSPLKMARLAA